MAQAPIKQPPNFFSFKANIANIIMGIISFLLVILIYMMINGDQYKDILEMIGLGYFAKKGVYADCSLPENRTNPFCQKKESKADRDWRDIAIGKGGKSQFSITDR